MGGANQSRLLDWINKEIWTHGLELFRDIDHVCKNARIDDPKVAGNYRSATIISQVLLKLVAQQKQWLKIKSL